MDMEGIKQEFKKNVCRKIRLLEEGEDRFRVFTPFRFDDGDHLVILLKKEKGAWLFSDEGHTYLHLSYRVDPSDLTFGVYSKLIGCILQEFQIEDRCGELIIKISDHWYGDALFRFSQALLKLYGLHTNLH